ncbi:MAG: GNAT family N-acetyltransferase [Desulfoprunum sp.]|nr:GNAT family N-acetyltransferase [Desulfoprunum sp.]
MISWQWSAFNELSREELYEILRVRQEIFTVEQNCAYQDADDLDQCALHLMGWRKTLDHRQLAAYLRVLPPESRFREPSIGRLLSVRTARGTGLGRAIMHQALARLAVLYPGIPIRISAQQYLESFYQDLGFTAASAIYEEDGIPHREMVRQGP